jgi:transitional endoplasmic reticulum ATPase
MDTMKKYRNFQDCARIYITVPRTYINRQFETNKQITKRIHDIILYRIFNVHDTFELTPRAHQKNHHSTQNGDSGNVTCFIENTYPQNLPVRIMDTTMVLLKYYNDNIVENISSFSSNNSNSYINEISDANINDKNSNVNNENDNNTNNASTDVDNTRHTYNTRYIDSITELLQIKIRFKSFLKKYKKVKLPTGVLLCGPPGVGKTWSVKKSIEKCNLLYADKAYFKMFSVDGTDIFKLSKSSGEGEAKLRAIFNKAHAHAYSNDDYETVSIIFIDEIDVLCPHRGEGNSTSTRFVAQLLTLMDGVQRKSSPLYNNTNSNNNNGSVYVFGATNRPDDLDEALRRPGRFDREITFKTPTIDEKVNILKYHCDKLKMSKSFDYYGIAKRGVGYTGADLSALCREAALKAVLSSDEINEQHFMQAMKSITPSMTRGEHFHTSLGKLNLSWDDIGGLDDVKRQVKRAIEWPFSHRDALNRMGIKPPKGLILFGPPGCAKTTIARTAASVSSASFITLSGGDMYSAFVGESERLIRMTFHKARQALPAIIFLDEIDSIVGKREFANGDGGEDEVQTRILSTLLNEMDGISENKQLLIIAATNRIDMVDPALLRPGRFDQHIHIPLPNASERGDIMMSLCRKIKFNNNQDSNLTNLNKEDLIAYAKSNACDGFSGAELKSFLHQKIMQVMKKRISA